MRWSSYYIKNGTRKATMREQDAIYGGEMSAHHYFRDFAYCDSGIIPWLLIWEHLSVSNLLLSELISERSNRFPSSGELNFTVPNAANCIERVQNYFVSEAMSIDELDGLSMSLIPGVLTSANPIRNLLFVLMLRLKAILPCSKKRQKNWNF